VAHGGPRRVVPVTFAPTFDGTAPPGSHRVTSWGRPDGFRSGPPGWSGRWVERRAAPEQRPILGVGTPAEQGGDDSESRQSAVTPRIGSDPEHV